MGVESELLGVGADLREAVEAPLAVGAGVVLLVVLVRLALVWSGVVPNWSFWLSMIIGREKEMKGIKRGPAAEAGWGVGFYS